jgi:GntR family transcriptional regulator, transcriptional repressor for pyruvate dehydrogenase complex
MGDSNMKLSEVVLSRGRISDQIKNAIKRAILDGEFKPGDKLPREDEIAVTFKVSKVSVREALRDLEGDGIIEKRRGIFGGNFVAQPGMSKMTDLMANFYQFGTVTPRELLELGQIMEPTSVSIAVKRRTDKDLERIRTNIQEREEAIAAGKVVSRKIPEFHNIVADSCQNQLFSAIMRSLMNTAVQLLPKDAVTTDDYQAHLRYSKDLFECMVRRDEKAAKKLMLNIFGKFMEIVRRDDNKAAD